jgi:hypothetical protein
MMADGKTVINRAIIGGARVTIVTKIQYLRARSIGSEARTCVA